MESCSSLHCIDAEGGSTLHIKGSCYTDRRHAGGLLPPLRCVHGDLAVTYGFQAVQVNSRIGSSYNRVSDKHFLSSRKCLESQSLAARQKQHSQRGRCPRDHLRSHSSMHPLPRVVQNPFLIFAAGLRRLRKTPGLRDTLRDLSRRNSHHHRRHRRKTLLWLPAAGLRRLRTT